ncbi:hypothetical protein [Flavobacterium sp. CAU 1735]|uniref:hypothetical protein n=1 Tax=Flavobacterium sp. CAU 1735 TaxID=3140361 RepID=UPI0032607210
MIALNRIFLAVSCMTLFSCSKSDSGYKLSGTFINTSYLEQSKTKRLRDIPFYGTEITFEKDSILFSNGFETGKLAYTQKGNQYVLKEAYQNNGVLKDMILEATSDTTFTLNDTEYTTTTTPSVFTKSKTTFESALAKKVIDGTYEILYPETLKNTRVTFSAFTITGLPDYNRYNLCYSGDCMQMITDTINSISLNRPDGSTAIFGWQNGQQQTLELYRVSDPIPDSKGGQRITQKAFILKKTGK